MDASEYSESGYNCAESVLLGLSDFLNEPCDCIPRIATGFGGGMKTGSVCGAVSGAVIAIGLHYGRKTAQDTEKRDLCYERVQEFLSAFKREHQTIICRDLLGVDITTEEGRTQYKKGNLHKKCESCVATAFRIARTLLAAE
ncbi:MAG: C_GCAxxG_C_C family protein [Theionarchaea archaeon]|nr:MAG: hypothetical protein AYK18_04485 [Theionarchaea archaeon DG-70]MBU7011543.1 C_GCAxxG_C_C family protein [Theionarchaea archaeon]